MTDISSSDVLHLAQLSSLQLTSDEVESLRTNLDDILHYIEQLSELDTAGVEPTYQVTDLQNVWRDDVVEDGQVTRDALLALAPDRTQDAVKVPKVL